jgi:mRNA interferase RelE/StbE
VIAQHCINQIRSEGTRVNSKRFQTQIAGHIRALSGNPFPQGVKKLHGSDAYRIRSGAYRILYTISGQTVTISAIGDRKDIYRH